MSAKSKKINNEMFKNLESLFKVDTEEEKIELKASAIQLDILDEVKKLMEIGEIKMTLTDLAKKLGKSKSFVSQLFSGDKALNLKMIAQFQEIFDVKFIPSFNSYSQYSFIENFKNEFQQHIDKYLNELLMNKSEWKTMQSSANKYRKAKIFNIDDYPTAKVA